MLPWFQALSEQVPGTCSRHPHTSLLVDITVNIDAATITICFAMIIMIARNTPSALTSASPSTTPPVLAHSQVTTAGVPETTQWGHSRPHVSRRRGFQILPFHRDGLPFRRSLLGNMLTCFSYTTQEAKVNLLTCCLFVVECIKITSFVMITINIFSLLLW